MAKEIVAFDLETSGLDIQKDYILQLCLIKFDYNTLNIIGEKCWYIKPTADFTINEEAEKVTGITKEFILKNGVLLKDIWGEAKDFIADCDILTYNGTHFDVPMLYHNLKREKLLFDFSCRKYFDSYLFEKKMQSLKLADVYKKYTKTELENAHDALYDVKATIEIFKYQKENFIDVIPENEMICISPDGFLKLNDENKLIFKQGKYKNKTTNEICKTDPKYIKWVIENFSKETVEAIKKEWYNSKS